MKSLEGADFTGANLQRARLSKSRFVGPAGPYQRTARSHYYSVPSGGANLPRADLREADLQEASLARCNLQGALLQGAHLREASFEGADLRGADLSGADVRGVRFMDAVWVDGTRCGPRSVGRCVPAPP
ncbi:pentapeptide repeat-containing protein [Cystobacter fuscus]|nr:pentapeptide repeat-containing protein [Cystobacter fuscus]